MIKNMEVVLVEQNIYENKTVNSLILYFSIPAIFSLLVEIMASVVDTAFAGHLLPSPEQREAVYHRIRGFRGSKPIFTMDFQNDAEYVGGCIAGGRNYLHINAKGDVEPCVFIHYSKCNIHNTSLLDVLKSPIFMAYHDNQPFHENMLRPCPMLENPEALRRMVRETDAVNTDYESPESVEHLCDKTIEYAENWKETADRLWRNCARCKDCNQEG